MRTGGRIGWAVGVLAMAAPWAWGQTAAASAASPQVVFSSPAPASASSPGADALGEIVREIDDPHSGDRWLLVRDASHPGGPGLLLLVSAARRTPADSRPGTQVGPGAASPAPAIRLGDRVIVEQHTPVIDARLEARALSPARVGSAFNVRLTAGGRVMRAVALGPGRAVFEEGTGR